MKYIIVMAMALLLFAAVSAAVEQPAAPQTPVAEEDPGTQTKTQAETIPTLGEWGMIIFCIALAGWMGYMVVRRRKRATVGI